MGKYKNRHNLRLRLISMVVVCLFFANSVSWAYQPDVRSPAANNTLQAQLLFKPILDAVQNEFKNQVRFELRTILEMIEANEPLQNINAALDHSRSASNFKSGQRKLDVDPECIERDDSLEVRLGFYRASEGGPKFRMVFPRAPDGTRDIDKVKIEEIIYGALPDRLEIEAADKKLQRVKSKIQSGDEVNVLFVCSANFQRSPFAEVIAKFIAADSGLENVHVSSCGTYAYSQVAFDKRLVDIFRKNNPGEIAEDILSQKSPRRRVDRETIENADIVIVGDNTVREDLEKFFPEIADDVARKTVYFTDLDPNLRVEFGHLFPDFSMWETIVKKNVQEYYDIVYKTIREGLFQDVFDRLSQADLKYGLVPGKLPKKHRAFYETVYNILFEHDFKDPKMHKDAERLARTITMMRPGSLEFIHETGVISEKEKDIFLEKKTHALKFLGEEAKRDLSRRLRQLVDSYGRDLAGSFKKHYMKRLVPLDIIEPLARKYKTSVSHIQVIIRDRPDFPAWLPMAASLVKQYEERLGGTNNAWGIFIKIGIDEKKADKWVAQYLKRVEEIQDKVGGPRNARFIVRMKGLDVTDEYIEDIAAKADEIKTRVGNFTNAMLVIIAQGLGEKEDEEGVLRGKVDAWIDKAEKKLEVIEKVVSGTSEEGRRSKAWQILIMSDLDKVESWLENAETIVKEIVKSEECTEAEAWNRVIAEGPRVLDQAGEERKKFHKIGSKDVKVIDVDEEKDIAIVKDSEGVTHQVNMEHKGPLAIKTLIRMFEGMFELDENSRRLIISMLKLIERSPPEIYVFSRIIEDLMAFSSPEDNMIAVFKNLKNNPLPLFHEVSEYLIADGHMRLEIEEGPFDMLVIKRKTLFGRFLDKLGMKNNRFGYKEMERIFISTATADFIEKEKWHDGWREDPHYLLRVLQREVFGYRDYSFTEELRLYQVSEDLDSIYDTEFTIDDIIEEEIWLRKRGKVSSGAEDQGGFIGKWQPLEKIEFNYDKMLEKYAAEFKVRYIETGAERSITLYARRAPPGTFENYRRTGITEIDAALSNILDGTGDNKYFIPEEDRFILEPNSYGIHGIGTPHLLAITDFLKSDGLAIFHELAHASGYDPTHFLKEKHQEAADAYINEEGKEYRKDPDMRLHYVWRFFQAQRWPEDNAELTEIIKKAEEDRTGKIFKVLLLIGSEGKDNVESLDYLTGKYGFYVWVKLYDFSKGKLYGIFTGGLKALKNAFSEEELLKYWPYFVHLALKPEQNAGDLFQYDLPALRKAFPSQEFTAYWPDFFELGNTAGRNSGVLFRYGLPALKETFTQEEFNDYWPVFKRWGIALGENAGYIFQHALPVIKGMINSKEDLDRSFNDLKSLAEAAGENAEELFEDGFPELKEVFPDDKLEEYWPVLVKMGKTAGEDAGILFQYGLPVLGEMVDSKEDLEKMSKGIIELCVNREKEDDESDDFRGDILFRLDRERLFEKAMPELKAAFSREELKEYWSDLVGIVKDAGESADTLFKDVIPGLRPLIQSREDLLQVSSLLLRLCDAAGKRYNAHSLLEFLLLLRDGIASNKDFEKVGSVLEEMAASGGENADHDFYSGLTYFKEAIAVRGNGEETAKNLKIMGTILAELLKGMGKNKRYFIQDGLQVFKETILAEDNIEETAKNLQTIGNILARFTREAGSSAEYFADEGLESFQEAIIADDIEKTAENLRLVGGGLVELAKASGKDVRHMFFLGLPLIKETFGSGFIKENAKELINRLTELCASTTDYNRERVLKLLLDKSNLRRLHEKNADLLGHLRFYNSVIQKNRRLAYLILEGITDGIEEGAVNADLDAEEQKLIFDFIDETNGFYPVIFKLYKEKGASVLDNIRRFGRKALSDEVGEEEIREFLEDEYFSSQDPEDEAKNRILTASFQMAIPPSGASFVSRHEVAGLLNEFRKAGDRRGDVPLALRDKDFGDGEKDAFQINEWAVKEGEQVDREREITSIISSLRQREIPEEKREEAKKEDKDRLVEALKKYFSDLADPGKRRACLEAFYAHASHSDLLQQKIDTIQELDYLNLVLLEELFVDKNNLRILLREALKDIEENTYPQVQIKTRKKIVKPSRFVRTVQGAWKSNEEMPDKKDAISGLIRDYDPRDITEKLIPLIEDAELKDFIRAAAGRLPDARTLTQKEIIEALFEGPLKAIEKEKEKFSFIEGIRKVVLKFRVVKGIPHGLWGLNAGVCVATDLALWKNEDFYLLEIYDRETAKVAGYVHLYETEMDGEKVLTLPGIEPSTEFLAEVRAKDLYPILEKALLRIKKEGGYAHLYIPTLENEGNITSNRTDIIKILTKRYGEPITLPRPVLWNTKPEPYPFDKVWEVGPFANLTEEKTEGASQMGSDVKVKEDTVVLSEDGRTGTAEVIDPETGGKIDDLDLELSEQDARDTVRDFVSFWGFREEAHKDIILEILSLFEKSPPLYVFNKRIKDLFGFAIPPNFSTEKGLIAIYKDFQESPVALFHELAEFLIKSNVLFLRKDGSNLDVYIFNEKRTIDVSNALKNLDENKEKWLEWGDSILNKHENQHYLLRIFQREVFGRLDENLSIATRRIQEGDTGKKIHGYYRVRTLSDYDGLIEEVFDGGRATLSDIISEGIEKNAANGEKINYLDACGGMGCAATELAERFGKEGLSAFVTDINEWDVSDLSDDEFTDIAEESQRTGIDLLSRKFKFIGSDITEMQLDEKMDLITCMEALFYVNDPLKALINLYNHLNKDGVLVVTYKVSEEHEEILEHLHRVLYFLRMEKADIGYKKIARQMSAGYKYHDITMYIVKKRDQDLVLNIEPSEYRPVWGKFKAVKDVKEGTAVYYKKRSGIPEVSITSEEVVKMLSDLPAPMVLLTEPGRTIDGRSIPKGEYELRIIEEAGKKHYQLVRRDEKKETVFTVDLARTTLVPPGSIVQRKNKRYRLRVLERGMLVAAHMFMEEKKIPENLAAPQFPAVRYFKDLSCVSVNSIIPEELLELAKFAKKTLEGLKIPDVSRQEVRSNPNFGWKLHLNFNRKDPRARGAIYRILNDLMTYGVITSWKIGGTKDTGKEATVFVGHGAIAKKVAQYIEEKASEWEKRHKGKRLLLNQVGRVLEYDRKFTSHIWGRFEPNDRERFYHYGRQGIPYMKKYGYLFDEKVRSENKEEYAGLREQAKLASHSALAEIYGEFYTSGYGDRPQGGTLEVNIGQNIEQKIEQMRKDHERKIIDRIDVNGKRSKKLFYEIKKYLIKAARAAGTQKKDHPIDIVIDLTLIPKEDISENAETLAYLILMCRDLKNVNFVFKQPYRTDEESMSGQLVDNIDNSAGQDELLEAVKKELCQKAVYCSESFDAGEFFEKRINSSEIRENVIEIPIINKAFLEWARDNDVALKENQYPVALYGFNNIEDRGVVLRNFEAALTIGLSKAALVIAKRRDAEKGEGDEKELPGLKKELREKLQRLYGVFRPLVFLNEDTLDYMISPYSTVRLNLAISLALPPLTRMAVEELYEFHEAMQLALQAV